MTTRYALIVEDLRGWQETLREALTDAGCQVRVAASYAEALEALAQTQFQLAVIDPVLDDINRHNRDGLRVLRHIVTEQPQMRAIVVTASDPDHIRREVGALSTRVPILWKDTWEDDQFQTVVRRLLAGKEL